MRVLIACEYSAVVRGAFRARGHHATSVDLLPTEGDPRFHSQGDIFEYLKDVRHSFDMLIAFPPCTYLTASNAWRWDQIQVEREEALDFVRRLMGLPIPRIAVENPSGAIGTQIRKADQYIQPWHFGDPYQKRTGLWLKNLPLLRPEVLDRPEGVVPWVQAGSYRGHKGVARKGKERSRTFSGIARAMAEQWGGEDE